MPRKAPSPRRLSDRGLSILEPWLDRHAGTLDAVLTYRQVRELAYEIGLALARAAKTR